MIVVMMNKIKSTFNFVLTRSSASFRCLSYISVSPKSSLSFAWSSLSLMASLSLMSFITNIWTAGAVKISAALNIKKVMNVPIAAAIAGPNSMINTAVVRK